MKKASFIKTLLLTLTLTFSAFNANLALAFNWNCSGNALNESFNAAANTLKEANDSLDLDNDTQLALYSLFKQATTGDKPANLKAGVFDQARKAMYKAWGERRGMSQHNAKVEYIKLANEILEVGEA